MKVHGRIDYFAATLVALALAGCDRSGSAKPAPAARAEVTVRVVDFAGIEQAVKDRRGQVVVMDAWSTACPPCVKEFPRLVALHKKYADRGLACISLSFDYEGTDTVEVVREPVLKFLREQGAVFENLLSSEESDSLYRRFKLAAVPAVFVYDRAGNLRKRFDNERRQPGQREFSYDDVERLVVELLAERPAPPAG